MNPKNILVITIVTGIAITVQLLGLVIFGVYDDWLTISIAAVSHVVAMIVLFGIHNWLKQRFYMPPFSVMLSILYLIFGLYYLISGFFSVSIMVWEGILLTLAVICPISIIGYILGVSKFSGYDFRFDTVMMVLIGVIYYFVLGKIVERFTVIEVIQKAV